MKFLTSKTWTRDNLTDFFKRTSESDFCSLENKTYAMLFFENSTRTHYSFNKAVQDLGGKVLDLNTSASSLSKGESFYDTVKTFESFGVDGIIIRSSIKEYWNQLDGINLPIINAGDGASSHPSQALLDMYTVYKEKGMIENQKILIIGDIKHSRVAKTNIDIWRKVGSQVDITGPMEFKIDDPGWIDEFDSKIGQYDVVMLLRIQRERLETEYNDVDYNNKYGLNTERLNRMKKDAIIMHPGPFNRGVELTDEVLDDHRCRIWEQVRNGVEVRKMILTVIKETYE